MTNLFFSIGVLSKRAAVTDEADIWNPADKQFHRAHVPTIISRVAGRTPERLPLSQIWGGAETSPGFSEERLQAADTAYPIITDDYYEGDGPTAGLVDGRHRKIKLQRQGATHADVVRLTAEDIAAILAAGIPKTSSLGYLR